MARTISKAVAVLNEALALEPQAVSDLFRYRTAFASKELADHPTIQVGENLADDADEFPFDLGMLGLLNGIFGTKTTRISMEVDDDFYDNPEALIGKFTAHLDWPTDAMQPRSGYARV